MASTLVTVASLEFYSHPDHRQDRWGINNVFRGKRDGYFLDIGSGPKFGDELRTQARRVWRQFYDRQAGLALRRIGRALRGGERRD